MNTALIASLMTCHLLWGVACGDVVAPDVEKTKESKKAQVESPGVVLFNLSDTGKNDARPAYYGMASDPNRFPNNMMFQAIAALPENNRLWTIYPDAFPEASNTLRSWRDFDVHDWNGTDPLPRMRPESYVRRIEGFQATGRLPKDLGGYSFLIDWENGATTVREMGLTYWSDTTSPTISHGMDRLSGSGRGDTANPQGAIPNGVLHGLCRRKYSTCGGTERCTHRSSREEWTRRTIAAVLPS